MDQASVAVIIPCFNAREHVGEAIESAMAQTHQPIEIVVVDDGSTDDSAEIVSRYAGIKLVRQPNQGLSAARNRGLAECSADFVVFLDADDKLLPGAIEAGLAVIRREPRAGLVYGRQRFIGRSAEFLEGPHGGLAGAGYDRFLAGDVFVPPACGLFRREAVERLGGFRAGRALSQDYELYLRLAREWPVVSHDELVVEYRMHENNRSGRMAKVRQLRTILALLDTHAPLVRGDARLEAALDEGRRAWKRRLSRGVFREMLYRLAAGQLAGAARALWTLLTVCPSGLRHVVTEPVELIRRLARGARDA